MSAHDVIGLLGGAGGVVALAREGLRTWRVRMRTAPQLAKIKDAGAQLAATAKRVDTLSAQHEDCERRNLAVEHKAGEIAAEKQQLVGQVSVLAKQNQTQAGQIYALAAELEQLRRQAMR